MIIIYLGRRGAGKTLSMVKDGYNFKCDGWKVYSNFGASFAEDITLDDLYNIAKSNIKNCVIMIDEIQILIDSRRSAKKENIDFTHFVQQIRKRNIIILSTTQFFGTVDVRLRQHVDIFAFPKFNKKYKVCEVTYVDATLQEEYIMLGFGVQIEERNVDNMVIVFDAEEVFDLYDTKKIIRRKERMPESIV